MHNRLFSPDPARRAIAQTLFEQARALPLVCPHGHVNPRILADEAYDWGTPVDLLIIPDHYIFRMLYSQGIPLEVLGIPRKDGSKVAHDHRKIWQTVCDHWHLFRATPTGYWLRSELEDVFGVNLKMNGENAQAIYDQVADKLSQPEFRPRQLFDRFNIEVLATTDAAADPLVDHQAIRASGWGGKVIPTFRPDAVINITTEQWLSHIEALGASAGLSIHDYRSFISALENRRAFFKTMGATATDHAAETAATERLSEAEASTLFTRALHGAATPSDAARFTGHMLIEMARMSIEDGLVMQLHIGSARNHNPHLFETFGRDMGADIPLASEFTRGLKPLLGAYGNDPRLTIVLFSLDESTYSRELAPLAGHYPALRLGPPWWFFDSINGMQRYLSAVVETAGTYNLAGFNDDTRAFPSIPARHDVWRRVVADWLAGMVVQGVVDDTDAAEMMVDLAYRLAKRTYRL